MDIGGITMTQTGNVTIEAAMTTGERKLLTESNLKIKNQSNNWENTSKSFGLNFRTNNKTSRRIIQISTPKIPTGIDISIVATLEEVWKMVNYLDKCYQ